MVWSSVATAGMLSAMTAGSVGASSGAVPQSGHDIMLGKAAFRTQSAW
jgi:hypothetical protein